MIIYVKIRDSGPDLRGPILSFGLLRIRHRATFFEGAPVTVFDLCVAVDVHCVNDFNFNFLRSDLTCMISAVV